MLQQSSIKLRNLVSVHYYSIALYLPTRAHRSTIQKMALCIVCQGIPTNFFDPVPPHFFSPRDRVFHYHHCTPSALRQSAANGCPMCKILACRLNDHGLPQECKDREPLTMKRANIDSQQAFGLWMGVDDISHNFFFVFPPEHRRLSYCHCDVDMSIAYQDDQSKHFPRPA